MLLIGDEALHLTSGLWIYDHIGVRWHLFFQIAFWTLLVLLVLFRKVKIFNLKSSGYIQKAITDSSWRPVIILLLLLFFSAYFLLLRDFTFYPQFIRYPHLIKLLYHITYSAFGITPAGPRMLQLAFYIMGAVYLYRSIALFGSRDSGLMGATIYLFLPVVFVYARLGEISCGTIFFVTLISFHFLRFIKLGDNRDLLLTSFFIGTGFMYKRDVLLMFFICTLYLIVSRVINRDALFKSQLKVMMISLVPIIPWMILGKFFSWRNYKIIWSNFRPFEGKVFSFFMHLPPDISWVLFVLFLFSVVFVLIYRRNTLSLYFGLLFLAYYFFLALDVANFSPRLAMTYYPAIAVYLSLFLSGVIDRIRWRHSFKTVYLILSIFLIIICTVPPINAHYLSSVEFIKLKYFPSDDAMQWVKENVKDGEKILTLRIMSSNFYRIKYGIDKDGIIDLWYETEVVSTPEKLKTFCRDKNISYIMVPYNPAYIKEVSPLLNIAEYIKKIRTTNLWRLLSIILTKTIYTYIALKIAPELS